MSGTSDIDGNDPFFSSFLPVEAAGLAMDGPAANLIITKQSIRHLRLTGTGESLYGVSIEEIRVRKILKKLSAHGLMNPGLYCATEKGHITNLSTRKSVRRSC